MATLYLVSSIVLFDSCSWWHCSTLLPEKTPPLAALVGDVVPRPRCPAGAIGRAHQGVAHDAGAN